MKNNKTKADGLASNNGICFDGDIFLRFGSDHSTGAYLITKMLIAWIATFSTAIMAASFIGYEADKIVLAFNCTIAILAVSLLSSKYGILKICAGLVGFIYTANIFMNREYVQNGFYKAVGMYLKKSGIPSGTLGAFAVSPQLNTPTSLLYFFNMLLLVVGIGTSLACVYRIDFPMMFIFTFPVFEIGMYQGMEAPTLAVVGMMVSWITVLSMHIINHSTNRAGRDNTYAIHERSRTFFFTSVQGKSEFYSLYIRYVSILTAVVFGVIIAFSAISGFVRPDSFTRTRANLHRAIMQFEAGDIDSFLSDLSGGSKVYGINTVGGTNGGVLGNTEGISFNGAAAMKIRTYGFSNTLYLKGYAAGNYHDNSWSPLPENDEMEKLSAQFGKIGRIPQDYDYMAYGMLSSLSRKAQPLVEMDITVNAACPKFVYAPYSTGYSISSDLTELGDKVSPYNDDYIRINKAETSYRVAYFNNVNWLAQVEATQGKDLLTVASTYYPEDCAVMKDYARYVHKNYSKPDKIKGVDKAFDEIVERYLDGNANNVSYTDAYTAVRKYFTDNFRYELMPGATPDGEDFIDNFLTNQKEGYCSYFASAGVELMRKFGYPARYVEGYMILPGQLTDEPNSGDMYEITVPDKCAHAWTEVFIDDLGWVPAEFTPGYFNDNPNLEEQEKKHGSVSPESGSEDESSSSQAVEDSETSSEASPESKSDNTSSEASDDSSKAAPVIKSSSSESDTSSSKAGGGIIASEDDDDGASPIAKTLMVSLISIVLVALGLLINRKYKLGQMEKRCSHGNRNKRVLNIYSYSLKYLGLLHIEIKKNISDLQLCEELVEKCHEKNITVLDEKLTELALIAVKAYMSSTGVTDAEAQKAEEILDFIRNNIVGGSLNGFEKFSARYLYCLY